MKFLVLALMFVSSVSSAGVLVGAGANMNFSLATSGREYAVQTPIAVRGGYRFPWADLLAEYSYIRSSTGTDMVSIAQANHEFLLWGRREFGLTRWLLPLVALGAGAHQSVVTTRFGSQTQTEAGAVEGVLAAAAGCELRLGESLSWTLEGRATYADAYAPNPLFGLASYLNVQF